MRNDTVTKAWTMLSATVTTTATVLNSLVTLPASEILQVAITPATAITLVDGATGVELGLAAGITKQFPVIHIGTLLKLKCASGTVATVVEVYYN